MVRVVDRSIKLQPGRVNRQIITGIQHAVLRERCIVFEGRSKEIIRIITWTFRDVYVTGSDYISGIAFPRHQKVKSELKDFKT